MNTVADMPRVKVTIDNGRTAKDPFADLRNHIQELTDAAALRERELMDANVVLLHELNAVRAELQEVFDQSRGHDVVAPEAEVLVIEASPLAAYEPWTPPKTGSKGYQRRQNQRWPKGR